MNKLYSAVILFLFFSSSSKAQFYSQYFDGADTAYYNSLIPFIDSSVTNVWQIGNPNKILFHGAASAPFAIVTDTINAYPMYDTSSFILKLFPSWWWGIFALEWYQKLDMDQGYDGGIVEYSTDHGTTWENVFNNPYVYNLYGFQPESRDTLAGGEFAFSGTDTTWRDVWLCFDYSWMWLIQDTIYFRFTLLSDGAEFYRDGWMIDNIIGHITIIHTIKAASLPEYINVFPNPATGIVNIETEKKMEFHIIEEMELTDSRGKLVRRWENIPTKFWFDSRDFSPGQYYLYVKTNFKSQTIPLSISRY